MSHSEYIRGWELKVSSHSPYSDRPWTVRAGLVKYVTPPAQYTYGASTTITGFATHLNQCQDAWERLAKVREAAGLGVNLREKVHRFDVSRDGVQIFASGYGQFAAFITLFADETSYKEHRDLMAQAQARAEEVARAFVTLGEIPEGAAWHLET
jgi:hypothetical protein